MTTDQIKLTVASLDTADSAAGAETEDVLEAAQAESKQILAKARYEAFRMVTDARNEAEAILAEAERHAGDIGTPSPEALDASTALIAGAEAQAAQIIAEAEQSAAALRETARSDLEVQNASLQARHDALESKVASTQALLKNLEARLARIASPTASIPYSLGGEPDPGIAATVGPTDEAGRQEAGGDEHPLPPAASVVLDYSPSVPHKSKEPDPEPEPPSVEQGSFYTRHSAKLPRIGATSDKNALTAMRSVRTKNEPYS